MGCLTARATPSAPASPTTTRSRPPTSAGTALPQLGQLLSLFGGENLLRPCPLRLTQLTGLGPLLLGGKGIIVAQRLKPFSLLGAELPELLTLLFAQVERLAQALAAPLTPPPAFAGPVTSPLA